MAFRHWHDQDSVLPKGCQRHHAKETQITHRKRVAKAEMSKSYLFLVRQDITLIIKQKSSNIPKYFKRIMIKRDRIRVICPLGSHRF